MPLYKTKQTGLDVSIDWFSYAYKGKNPEHPSRGFQFYTRLAMFTTEQLSRYVHSKLNKMKL